MSQSGKTTAASARQRLSRIATDRGVDFQQVLVSYAVERLLYRLSVSSHARSFILKGATLFTLWEGFPHRQTRDLDLLGFDESTGAHLEATFREAPDEDCAMEWVPENGWPDGARGVGRGRGVPRGLFGASRGGLPCARGTAECLATWRTVDA